MPASRPRRVRPRPRAGDSGGPPPPRPWPSPPLQSSPLHPARPPVLAAPQGAPCGAFPRPGPCSSSTTKPPRRPMHRRPASGLARTAAHRIAASTAGTQAISASPATKTGPSATPTAPPASTRATSRTAGTSTGTRPSLSGPAISWANGPSPAVVRTTPSRSAPRTVATGRATSAWTNVGSCRPRRARSWTAALWSTAISARTLAGPSRRRTSAWTKTTENGASGRMTSASQLAGCTATRTVACPAAASAHGRASAWTTHALRPEKTAGRPSVAALSEAVPA
mmetsp:Transcript_64542/g.187037  ORF Transcript_64542/g.187037 Transcript_64542/m.187037 type:complete len:282 (+) Transcript_64542:165-1010(+)